jgi:hypothetical protein
MVTSKEDGIKLLAPIGSRRVLSSSLWEEWLSSDSRAQSPTVIENKHSIAGQLTATVKIGFKDRNPCGGVDEIGLRISHIEPDPQNVITGN